MKSETKLGIGDTVPESWGSQMAGGFYAGEITIKCIGADWFIELPDGSYEIRATKDEAEKRARQWFRQRTPKLKWSVGKLTTHIPACKIEPSSRGK